MIRLLKFESLKLIIDITIYYIKIINYLNEAYMQTFILLSITVSIMCVVYFNISKIYYKKIEKIVFIISSILVSWIILDVNILNISNIFMIISLVIIMILFLYKKIKNISLSVFYSLITIIIYILNASITSFTMDIIFDPVTVARENVINSWTLYLIYSCMELPMAYVFSRIIGNFINKKLNVLNESLRRKFCNYVIIGAFIAFALLISNVFLPQIIEEYYIINAIYIALYIIYFCYFVFTIYTFTDSQRKNNEIIHKEEMLENLRTYTVNIENNYASMRKYRHDHLNILLGLHGHIQNDDMDGVKNYFSQYISPFAVNSLEINKSLDKLNNIKITELKSILSLKLLYAQEAGVQTNIEINDPINDAGVDLVDICRITGILIDNAIEACRDTENPVLSFAAVIKDKNELIFIFSNTCKPDIPLNQIFEKGFTTKENGEGLGLFIVNQIIEKNKNIMLKTELSGDVFIQELTIQLTKIVKGDKNA